MAPAMPPGDLNPHPWFAVASTTIQQYGAHKKKTRRRRVCNNICLHILYTSQVICNKPQRNNINNTNLVLNRDQNIYGAFHT